jgi:hypothetical protein
VTCSRQIGTGFSDEVLTKHFDFFKAHILEVCWCGGGGSFSFKGFMYWSLPPQPPLSRICLQHPSHNFIFGASLTPDVWFEACQVWEVRAADLSISPVHKAAVGRVRADRGLSLRFPRLVRVREDKTYVCVCVHNALLHVVRCVCGLEFSFTSLSHAHLYSTLLRSIYACYIVILMQIMM